MTAIRDNKGKPKWSLVPQSALEPMVRVLEYGSEKYGNYNWTKGMKITEICESLKRHLDAFMEGQNEDRESGLSQIGHIQANAMFLAWMMKNKNLMDDRFCQDELAEGPKKEELIEKFEKKANDILEKPLKKDYKFGSTIKHSFLPQFSSNFLSFLYKKCSEDYYNTADDVYVYCVESIKVSASDENYTFNVEDNEILEELDRNNIDYIEIKR